MTFGKYQSDGAYHWDAASHSLTRHVAFTAGRYQAVLDQPVVWRGSRVLDVACGDAWLTAAVAARGARQVIGVDSARTGLSAGRARWSITQPATLPAARLVQGDALHLPVASGAFDIVIASELIEHVDDPAALLRELTRPLRAAGALIVSTPYRLTEKPLDPYHVREFFPGELENLMHPLFRKVMITLSHPAWVTSLYTLRGRAWPFRLLVNALSIGGRNPFLKWPMGRYAAQITVLGQGRAQ